MSNLRISRNLRLSLIKYLQQTVYLPTICIISPRVSSTIYILYGDSLWSMQSETQYGDIGRGHTLEWKFVRSLLLLVLYIRSTRYVYYMVITFMYDGRHL